MVVIVVHPILVASGGADRLDTSKKTVLDQYSQCVVDRLARDSANVRLRHVGDLVGRHVRLTGNRPQHRDALSRRLDATIAKLVDRAGTHSLQRSTTLDQVQYWNDSSIGQPTTV